MCSRFRKHITTILLFCGILSQSCGNPNWDMVEPVGPAASGETSKSSQAKERALAKLLPVQKGSSEGSILPKVDRSPEVDSALSAKTAYNTIG
jgi:hypothetical protein